MDHGDTSGAAVAGMLGFGIVMGIFALALTVFGIWLWWRILEKAGYNGALSLLMLTGVGGLVLQIILAFGRWPLEDRLAGLQTPPPAGEPSA